MKALGRAILTAVLSSMALVLSAGAAQAAPQGPWALPVEDLSVPGQVASEPAVASAPDGTAIAVWRRSDGANFRVQLAARQPGGSFSNPVDLSAPGQNAFAPEVAVAPDGTTTVVWHRSNGSNNIIQAATRPPGGSFGAPVDLSAPGGNASFPRIATAADGTTTVVWQRFDGSDTVIQAATRPPGGSFGAPVNLSAPGQDAQGQQLASAADGTTTAVWSRSNGSNNIIQAATRPNGGSFGAPVDLSAPGESATGPQITVAPDGTATAVWGRDSIVQAATRIPGGAFGAPVDIGNSGFMTPAAATVTAAPDGTTTAAWLRFNGGVNIIQAATRPPGGAFGTAVNLSAPGENAFQPQIAAAPDGTTTVVWNRDDGPDDRIQATTRPPGGAFAAPVTLSAPGQDSYDSRITVAADGTTTVVWNRALDIIQSISTARPSPALGVNPTGTGTGQVTSTPAGINCGNDCAENYLSFTEVTLTATPDPGSTFTGWSGGGCSGTGTCEVTVVESTTVTAEFTDNTPPERLLQVNRKGNGGGTVTSTPAGINCGNDCAENYPSSTVVILTASPNTAATFNGWSGGGCSGTGNCVVTLEEATTVSATFGKPKLAALKISPKTRNAKPGKKAVIKVTVKNDGDGKTKNLKVCASVPKKLLQKPACKTPGNPGAGKSKTATFAVKVKNSAKKGKKPKVTFTATATGGFKKTGKATVKVK